MDHLLFKMASQKKMLGDFPNIVFLVTHIDTVTPSKESISKEELICSAIQQLRNAMAEVEMTNQVIFLSNNLVDEETLAGSIYTLCKSMPQKSVKIDEMTFHKYFNMKK